MCWHNFQEKDLILHSDSYISTYRDEYLCVCATEQSVAVCVAHCAVDGLVHRQLVLLFRAHLQPPDNGLDGGALHRRREPPPPSPFKARYIYTLLSNTTSKGVNSNPVSALVIFPVSTCMCTHFTDCRGSEYI